MARTRNPKLPCNMVYDAAMEFYNNGHCWPTVKELFAGLKDNRPSKSKEAQLLAQVRYRIGKEWEHTVPVFSVGKAFYEGIKGLGDAGDRAPFTAAGRRGGPDVLGRRGWRTGGRPLLPR